MLFLKAGLPRRERLVNNLYIVFVSRKPFSEVEIGAIFNDLAGAETYYFNIWKSSSFVISGVRIEHWKWNEESYSFQYMKQLQPLNI